MKYLCALNNDLNLKKNRIFTFLKAFIDRVRRTGRLFCKKIKILINFPCRYKAVCINDVINSVNNMRIKENEVILKRRKFYFFLYRS